MAHDRLTLGVEIPAHVPPECVVDVDLYQMPGADHDLHLPWKTLRDSSTRSLLWTPRNGGHWIVTRGRDISRIYADHENYSSNITIVPRELGEQFPLRPTTVDPPEHRRFRQRINAALTPAVVRALEPIIRRLTVDAIEGVRESGRCEFIAECAVALPIGVFAHLANLPPDIGDTLPRYAEEPNGDQNTAAASPIMDRFAAFVRPWVLERREHPGADLISTLLVDAGLDKPLTDDEAVDVGVALLTGGLDTVVSSLALMMIFLADHPVHRQRLIKHPAMIRPAVAEMLRRFPIMTKGRLVRHDQVIDGVDVKAGDMIVLPPLHGLDEREFADPLTVDFDRAQTPNSTFGNGVHRCPGAHLSHLEMETVIREWLARIPDFGIDAARPPIMRSGILGTVLQLGLQWDPSTTHMVSL